MDERFNDEDLAQWCAVYVRFVVNDSQRLAIAIKHCRSEKLQEAVLKPQDINGLLEKTSLTDADYLAAYGYLLHIDTRFWQCPSAQLLDGHIEKTVSNSRYLLIRRTESPIVKAIDGKQRFKADHTLGTSGDLQLRHAWQALELSTELELCRSDVFDTLTDNLKIGLSPYADKYDMDWACAADDPRGLENKIPFWCCGSKISDAALRERVVAVLAAAYQQDVHVLLFPELVMTAALQADISQWLKQHNAFQPKIRLVVAGTRHVHADNPEQVNTYSNRCTVLNHIGDSEWQQDKRQPFDLSADEAHAFFGITAPAFEPTDTALHLKIRQSALGNIATAICLDFLHDKQWQALPVDVFFVPAMSSGLSRFEDRCRNAGNVWGSTVLVCNAKKDGKAVLAYIPSKNGLLTLTESADFLFTANIAIEVN